MKYGKTAQNMTRSQEQAASRRFGQHVSREKALVSALVTTLFCALPMLLGLRLWERIPAIVETGLVGPSGQDDSMPRAVLVFGVPGLGCVLNAIVHGQLWLHQRAERVPPAAVRLLGRWSLAPITLLLASYWMLRAAGQRMEPGFGAVCVLGLLLLLLGGHFFDCSRDAKLAFRIGRLQLSQRRWKLVHRIAGLCWMLAGLLLAGLQLSLGTLPLWSVLPVLLLLLSPLPAAWLVKE